MPEMCAPKCGGAGNCNLVRLSSLARRLAQAALAAALLCGLAWGPAWSQAQQKPSLDKVLSGIELRYNRLATLQIDFEHAIRYLGRPPMVERGTLYLRRPQMMRWEYSRPAGKLLVGDGDLLHYYNPLSNQVRQLRPSQTGDYRVPLSFLLGRLRFGRQFRRLRLEEIEGRAVLVGEGRTGQEAYSKVEFTYDPASYQLLHLKVYGQDESVATFAFSEETVNPRLEETLFDFRAPPGAEIVDQTQAGDGN
jgi:outer membrane lipoprotein carrier protein